MRVRGDLEDLGVDGCQNGSWRGRDGRHVLDPPGSILEQVAACYEPLGTKKLVACSCLGLSVSLIGVLVTKAYLDITG